MWLHVELAIDLAGRVHHARDHELPINAAGFGEFDFGDDSPGTGPRLGLIRLKRPKSLPGVSPRDLPHPLDLVI